MSTPTSPTSPLRSARLPAPALFVGPPSANTSTHSLLLRTTTTQSSSTAPGPSPLSPLAPSPSPFPPPAPSKFTLLHLSRPAIPPPPRHPHPPPHARHASVRRTLDDVDAAAATAPAAGVFGPGHAGALAELRAAQVALSELWTGREEADAHAAAADEGAGPRSGEADLRAALERRRRNEEYFAVVRRSVGEVVGRLDRVGKAMRRVEVEGREVWEDDDDDGVGSGDSVA